MNAIQRAIQIIGGPSEVARQLGVTAQAVCFWRDGRRSFPVIHALTVERLTSGAVTRRDLFPHDFSRIWPDIAVSAPNPPQPIANGSFVAANTVANAEA